MQKPPNTHRPTRRNYQKSLRLAADARVSLIGLQHRAGLVAADDDGPEILDPDIGRQMPNLDSATSLEKCPSLQSKIKLNLKTTTTGTHQRRLSGSTDSQR